MKNVDDHGMVSFRRIKVAYVNRSDLAGDIDFIGKGHGVFISKGDIGNRYCRPSKLEKVTSFDHTFDSLGT